jgi:beta-1,4-mannosyltransferase
MTLRIAFLPVYQNPYQHLLTRALQQIGVEVEHLGNMPSAAWLLRRRGQVQVLHLHWLYGLYMRHYLTPVRLGAFLSRFLLAQQLGYRIVWTVHNIMPHRQPFPPMHRMVRRFVMKRADAVIAHCEFGRREICRQFTRDKATYVVAHGNYVGVHSLTLTREEAREALGLESRSFVYLLLGNISRYKGIHSFADAFLQIAELDDIAVIAGRSRDHTLVRELRCLSAADPRIKVHTGFIPDDEMQRFLLAADVMVFCFREILTSGSVILGLSYGLPVIAPSLGCLPELVAPEAGILYDPKKPTALSEALREIRIRDTAEMGARAKEAVDTLRWDDIAQQTAGIYRTCLE